jgi:hypothetical protein
LDKFRDEFGLAGGGSGAGPGEISAVVGAREAAAFMVMVPVLGLAGSRPDR